MRSSLGQPAVKLHEIKHGHLPVLDDANKAPQPAPPVSERLSDLARQCGVHIVRTGGATLTGAMAGFSVLGLTSISVEGGVYGAAAFGALAGVGHVLKTIDPERMTEVSDAIMALEGILVKCTGGAIDSMPWAYRYYVLLSLVLLATQTLEERSMAEATTGIAFAASLSPIVHTVNIGSAAGAVVVLLAAWQKLINTPGELAGTPLRVPQEPLGDVLRYAVYLFLMASVVSNSNAVIAGQTNVAPGAPEARLAANEVQSAFYTSATAGFCTILMSSIFAIERSTAGNRTKPLEVPFTRENFWHLWRNDIRTQVVANEQVALHCPLPMPDMQGASIAKRVLIDLLRLPFTASGGFAFSAAANYWFAQEPLDPTATTAGVRLLAANAPFVIAWMLELVALRLKNEQATVDAVDTRKPDGYTDIKNAIYVGLSTGGTMAVAAPIIHRWMDEAGVAEVDPFAAVGICAAFGLLSSAPYFFTLTPTTTLVAQTYMTTTIGGLGAVVSSEPAAIGVLGATVTAGKLIWQAHTRNKREELARSELDKQAQELEERAGKSRQDAAQRADLLTDDEIAGNPDEALRIIIDSLNDQQKLDLVMHVQRQKREDNDANG